MPFINGSIYFEGELVRVHLQLGGMLIASFELFCVQSVVVSFFVSIFIFARFHALKYRYL